MSLRYLALLLGVVTGMGGVCLAEPYPSKPITVIVPLAAGTGLDSLVRAYTERLSRRVGQPVLVDNRPGASTMIGTAAVAKAAPDGHTLLVATIGAMVLAPIVYKNVSYDAEADFVPIALYVKSPFVLVVNPALRIESAAEFIAYAKQTAVPLSFSSVGIGSPQHLSMEYLKQRFGVAMTHVPYRNSGQSITDIAGGHVSAGFADAGTALPIVRSGSVKAIAVSSAVRLPLLPDVSPLAEAVNAPGFEMVGWHALFAPANTPTDIVDRLHAEMKAIMSEAEIRGRALSVGLIPIETPPVPAIRAFIASEREKWGGLVRYLGLAGSQ